MPTLLRRRKKKIDPAHRPTAVTGSFELHYEEVVRSNRFVIVAFAVTGLLALAAFVPTAVYHSVAGSKTVTVEAENAEILSGIEVSSDADASDGRFLLFTGSKD